MSPAEFTEEILPILSDLVKRDFARLIAADLQRGHSLQVGAVGFILMAGD
jgi:hypothetical protein